MYDDEMDELIDAMWAIDLANRPYEDYMVMCAVAAEEGIDPNEMERIMSQDGSRYHYGETTRKMESFGRYGDGGATRKSIFKMAYEDGWEPERAADVTAFDFSDTIDTDDGETIATTDAPIMTQEEQAIAFLETFEPDEHVHYVTRTYVDEDGHEGPARGYDDRTAGELIAEIKANGFRATFGDIDENVGMWMVANPVKGIGRRKNEDATAYRYIVAESDENGPDEFIHVTKALGLPVATLVTSGNKSVHARIKVDAADAREYRDAWKLIREAYDAHGITLDKACKNVSRLTRFPGVMRNGKPQQLLAVNFGAASFSAWKRSKEKPLLPPWDDIDIGEEIEDDAELVEGVLRYGEVGLITARAKRGKTWLMIQLAVAVATGGEWIGHKCKQGRVLIIDPECKPKTLRKRIQLVSRAMRADQATVEANVKKWSLRGTTTSKGDIVDITAIAHDLELISERFDLVILDSSSAFLEPGCEENDNASIRKFITGHVSRIAKATGGAVIMVHHEGKGATGDRAAEDRARGAGAWVDCPDLVMQLSSIYPPEGEPEDYLPEGAKARRLECVAIRDNAEFKPLNLVYQWPLYRQDDTLEDWVIQTSARLGGKAAGAIQKQRADERAETMMRPVFQHLATNGGELTATEANQIIEQAYGQSLTYPTLKRYVERFDGLAVVQNGRRWSVAVDPDYTPALT